MGRHPGTGFIAILAILLFTIPRSFAKSVAYCSSENTSDEAAKNWAWQSNGWCNDACKDSHPFGVILGQDCWCSDYIPSDQVDTSECSSTCPGFPSEFCGNDQKNLYIYIRLDSNAEVLGTKGTSQPTSSSVSPSSSANPIASQSFAEAPFSSEVKTPSSAPPSPVPSSSAPPPDPETVVQTVTISASVVTLTPTPDPTSASTPSQSPVQSTFKTTTAAPVPTDTVPVTSVHLVTVSGVIVTQTVVTTPSAVPAQTSQQKQKTPVGAIVGGVIGGFTVLGAIVGSVIFALWRRRRQQQQDDDEDRSGVHRNTSTMSKAGLVRGEMGPQYPPKIATTFNSRNSRVLDNDSITPISGSDRRSSRLVFDQRLNPSAIMVLDNPSRESFVSMDDSRDYGRTLNVRNPDPDTR